MLRSMTLGTVAAAGVVLAATTAAAAPNQPPMNSFNSSYYVCDNGGQFAMSYDSARPQTAKMTTSNNNHTYELKRQRDASGVKFAGGPVSFWTDGTTTKVTGTEVPLDNCKAQSS